MRSAFLNAFKLDDVSARQTALQDMMVALVKSVSEKMKGFSRKETQDYYKNIMEQAWAQVEAPRLPRSRVRRSIKTSSGRCSTTITMTVRGASLPVRYLSRCGGEIMTRPIARCQPRPVLWRLHPRHGDQGAVHHPCPGRIWLLRWSAAYRPSQARWSAI